MVSRFDWRHQYDDERDAFERELTDISFVDSPSLTQQHFAKDADLNTVLKRYGISDGQIPPAAADGRYYGDFSDVFTFREALDRTRDAVAKFNALPAALRAEFNNDPVFLHDWVMDPKNADEAVALGLLQKKTVTQPLPSEPVPAVAPLALGT